MCAWIGNSASMAKINNKIASNVSNSQNLENQCDWLSGYRLLTVKHWNFELGGMNLRVITHSSMYLRATISFFLRIGSNNVKTWTMVTNILGRKIQSLKSFLAVKYCFPSLCHSSQWNSIFFTLHFHNSLNEYFKRDLHSKFCRRQDPFKEHINNWQVLFFSLLRLWLRSKNSTNTKDKVGTYPKIELSKWGICMMINEKLEENYSNMKKLCLLRRKVRLAKEKQVYE